jgi:hypothetical protein
MQEQVFPNARYVYIVRDGRDVSASAMQRWGASMDLPYLARKARFVPVTDLPHYAWRYAQSHLKRLASSQHTLSTWGPRFRGMDEIVGTKSLAEICARQWLACVESAENWLAESGIDAGRIHRVRYEDLAEDSAGEVNRLSAFLDARLPPRQQMPSVRSQSVGRWHTSLTGQESGAVNELLSQALAVRGYK